MEQQKSNILNSERMNTGYNVKKSAEGLHLSALFKMMARAGLLFILALFSKISFAQLPINGSFESASPTWNTNMSISTIPANGPRTGITHLVVNTSSTAMFESLSDGTITVANGEYVHIVGWAKTSNLNGASLFSIGVRMNGNNFSTAPAILGVDNIYRRLAHVVQNTTGTSQSVRARLTNQRNGGSGANRDYQWDDIIMYTSNSLVVDTVKPTIPTLFSTNSNHCNSNAFNWVNGIDAGSGLGQTIILRTTNLTPLTPELRDQVIYSTSGGENGPNIVDGWEVISTSVDGAANLYVDNSAAPGVSYRYAVVHRDRAFNYSSALVSPVVSFSSTSIPTITGTTPASRCGTGTVNLSASASAGTINWYAASTGGSPLGSGTSYVTPSISSTTTYWVDATVNGCTTGTRTEVVATVNAIPTITGTTPGSRCATGTVNLGANASAGIINWYAASTGGASLGTGTGFTTPSISSTTSYWVDATANGCITASRTQVVATVNAIPTITGTTPAARCATGTVNLGANASAGTINWYAASTGGASLGTGTSFTTPSISSTTTYWVDATANGCTTASRTAVTATINAIPTITGTTPGSRCATGTVNLGANASAGTINWYAASTGGASLGTGTSFTTPSISTTTSYWVDATANGCTTGTRTEVVATVNAIPTITGTTPAARCATGTVNLGANASAGTINWYAASTGGASLGTGTSFTTPSISATTSYWVDATANGCTTGTRTEVVATVNAIPTITGTTPGARCEAGTVSLGAASSAGTINWYAASTGGISLGTGTSFTTPIILTTTTYWVDATANGCTSPSRTAVVASVTGIPTITGTTPGSRCGTGTVNLGANASAGTINWYADPIGGASLGTGTSFTTPSISATTVYWVDATVNGCITAVRTAVTATVNTIPTITGTTPASRCGTGTLNLGALASAGTINWYAASTGGSSLGTGINYTTPVLSANTTYWVDATSNGCTTPARSAVLATVTTINQWTGTLNTDWNIGANWGCNVPDTNLNVLIPTGLANYPVIGIGNVGTVKDITIQSNASLTINNNTIRIFGDVTNNGSFTATNGTVEFAGASPQFISSGLFATNTIKDLTVNNVAGVTLGGELNITGVLTISNGSLNTGDHLVLKSSVATTARVATITSASPTPISGRVTVERYVPGRRRYRLITSSVTTSELSVLGAGQEHLSIWGNWQNSGNNVTPNQGTIITGGTSANGFDTQTPSASLFTYNDSTRRFVSHSTTNGKNTRNTPLKAGEAYYMFVYGDRTNTITTSNPNPTVLKATGTLLTGDRVYTTATPQPLSPVVGRFTFLGNPYASPINWATVTKSNISNTYWGWDPNLSGTGGYVTVNVAGGSPIISPLSPDIQLDQLIQPGQGFFVQTTGANPQMIIKETDKSAGINNLSFRTVQTLPVLAVNLLVHSGISKILGDGTVAVFGESFSNQVNDEDALKLTTSAEAIGIFNSGNLLSIEARQMPANNDTLRLNVFRLTKPQYTLQIFANNIVGANVQPYLEDNYLQTSTFLSVADTNNITFSVIPGVPASSDTNRFRIVFKQIGVLPVNFVQVGATKKGMSVQVDWTVAQEQGVSKYEVERSSDGVNFTKIGQVFSNGNSTSAKYYWLDNNPGNGANYYRIKVVNK